jgi:LPS export ABC transporter protein LptC
MRWQKKARFAIATSVLVFAVVVFIAMRRTPPAPPPEKTPVKDTQAQAQTTGYTLLKRTDRQGKLLMSIAAQGTRTYEGGRNVLEHVTITMPDRDGRTFTITGDEAEVAAPADGSSEISNARVKGNVHLSTSDGVTVSSAEAAYEDKTGIVNVPGQVHFSRGRMTGTGVGATYDRNRNVLWLLDQARVSVAPDETGGGRVEASAKTAGLARAEHYVRLTGAAHIVSDARTIDADDVTALLTPDDQRIQTLQLRGNSRIMGTGGSGDTMAAKDIDLTYAPDGRTLQRAHLMEQSSVQLAGNGGAAGRRITARTIDLAMGPDGTTMTGLNAVDGVVLDLAAQGDVPARTIRAATLTAAGVPGAGLQTATFDGQPVEFREKHPATQGHAAAERVARAAKLVVHTKPGFGDIEQAEFLGGVRIEDGQTRADAPRALYQVAKDRMDLAPTPSDPATPNVTDGQMTVNAKTIELTMSTKSMKGDGAVRSVLQRKSAAADGRGGGRGGAPQHTSLLAQDENVTVTSNHLEYDGSSSRAKYTGTARLSQGSTEVKADAIDVDDKSSNMTARGTVRTKMMIEDVDPKTNERKLSESTGTSETFTYDDAKRLAVYLAGPGARARMVGPQGDITGDRIELYLQKDDNALDRAEAFGTTGGVVVVDPTRTVKGTHMTYTAANDTYVMTGAPVEIFEREGAACKQTLAAVVTFNRSADKSDAQGAPMKSTSGVACPGQRD